jgi:hypothetical protein
VSDPQTRHVIDDLRAGRNGYDAPWAIFDTECVDAVNVDFYKARLGNKRGGMAATTLTSTTRTGVTSSLFRHVPGTDETLAELWAVDDAATPIIERLAGGTAWAAPSIKDAPTGNGWDFSAASINGKLFLAYKSGQDRLHVWDGSTVRRAGLTDIALPSPADTVAGGAYPAVQRYYRVRLTVQVATVTVRRSEPSPGAAFTPSGVNLAVRVTNSGGLPGEGETHWELEASTDNVLYYRIATVVIGTTFYDDSAAVGTYNANPLSALSGTYETQISYKFIAADQNRLLGFGAWNTAQKQARIHISAVIGSLDVGDEERLDINSNYYMDFDESDSGVATGMAGPIFGAFFCFKDRQVWQLTPTGTTVQPYRQEAISKSIGTISHHAIARGEDRHGNAALYWMSHRGMYRWSINGLEYIGRNMEDYVLGPNATINLAATKSVARVAYYADKRQIWCWWATASGNDCNVCAFFDVQTDGWSRVPTGDLLANIRCVAPFATTIAAAMSRDLKLHVGQTGGVTRIWKTDTGTDDNATTYQAYVLTKASEPGGPGFYGGVGDATLLAKAAAGVTITATVTADFGVQSVTGTALLTADGSETRVTRRLEGSALSGDVRFLQYQLGDAAAVSNAWTLDRLVTVPTKHEAVSA